MYRVYVEGRWLPWVSNANPEWMRSVQAKYNLDGTLDDSAYYAGINGKNISGIEVRIFEENNANIPDTPQTPSGQSKIIDAPFISQNPNYPTGCESVSTVMALQYAGVNISVDKFIDNYLYKTGVVFDPNESFGGDPRGSGYGCYSPVIKKALDKCFTVEGLSNYSATELKNVSLQQLCTDYIDKDIPVILWATMGMDTPKNGNRWYYNGKLIQWIIPEHCLLLVGYDDEHYIFNDPLRSKQTYYRKSAVEIAYAGLFKQAVVIEKKPIETPETAIIVIPGIMGSELFEGTKSYENRLWDPTPPSMIDGPKKILRLVCNPDGSFVNPVYADNLDYGAQGTYKELYNKLYENYTGQYIVDYFPYDWRMFCSVAWARLDNYINDKGYKKFILVAHSMGGLVASNYIMTLKVKEQLYKVDKLITLGTPFLGAPKLIDVFLNGNALDDAMTDWWLNITGAIPGIMPNMTSIYELLPTQQWFTTANKTLFTHTNYYNVPGHPDEGVSTVSTTYSDTRTRLYEKMDNINMSLLSKAENMHSHLFTGSSHITSFVDSYIIFPE